MMSRLAALASALVLCGASLLLPAAGPGGPAAGASVSAQAAESASQKLDRILRDPPSSSQPATTRFTEEEVNSYLYYHMASQYPPGISKIHVSFSPGFISGSAEVDFDKLKSARSAGGQSAAMWSYLLWGVHTIASEGAFSAVNGMGHFDLGSVSIDGVTLPRSLVDFLVDAYLKPRFPGFGLDQPFRMPDPIDTLQVEQGSVEATTRAAHLYR
jgi:hypothetical protein